MAGDPRRRRQPARGRDGRRPRRGRPPVDEPSYDADLYPDGVNVEFVVRRGPDHVAMRVHERGSGETRSCGTGACAAAVAAAGDGPGGGGSTYLAVSSTYRATSRAALSPSPGPPTTGSLLDRPSRDRGRRGRRPRAPRSARQVCWRHDRRARLGSARMDISGSAAHRHRRRVGHRRRRRPPARRGGARRSSSPTCRTTRARPWPTRSAARSPTSTSPTPTRSRPRSTRPASSAPLRVAGQLRRHRLGRSARSAATAATTRRTTSTLYKKVIAINLIGTFD